MRSDAQAAADRGHLLDKLKERYEPGAMRPQLYTSIVHHADKMDLLKFQWMFYAGMGEVDFRDATPKEQAAAIELLDSGWLVSTDPYSHYGAEFFQRIQLMEDLNWGLTYGGHAVIFSLSDTDSRRDMIIHTDETYGAALDELRKRIHYGSALPGDPIELSDGTPVVPIHFDKERPAMAQRQQAFTADMC